MKIRLLLLATLLGVIFTVQGEIIQFYEGNNFGRQKEDSTSHDARLSLCRNTIEGDFSLLCVFRGKSRVARRDKSKSLQDTEFTLGDYRIIFRPEKYVSVDGPEMRTVISVYLVDSLISTGRIDRFSPLSDSSKIRIQRRGRKLLVEAGKSTLKPVLEVPVTESPLTGISLHSEKTINPYIRYIALTCNESRHNRVQTPYTSAEELTEYFQRSSDPIEGFWKVLDREMDEKLLKMGGSYTIAIIRSGNGYDLIYMDGAQINRDEWERGLLKGKLEPTEAESVYDAEWIDSMFDILSKDVRATISLPTLTITFPYQDSRIRLHKTSNVR